MSRARSGPAGRGPRTADAPAASAAPAPAKARGRRATRTAASGAIVLDSPCWLEYFSDTGRADLFASAIESVETLVVPVSTIYEVVEKPQREAGDETASAALSLMHRGHVVAIDLPLALDAAVNGLPMADSLIHATARHHGATLWTQDADFDGLPGVRYFPKA